jgi:tetratricopeptide (TPR) repeat protein
MVGGAAAEVPLPDYRDALARQRWYKVNAILDNECAFDPAVMAVVCAQGATERVTELVDEFQRQVAPDGGLEYLAALAARYDGDTARAVRRYRTAIELDPDDYAAWYDLGEIYLEQTRWDLAGQAFARVSELHDAGKRAWIGPWRQAEVAAHQHDPDAFERHVKIALERGFTFRQIAGLPNWQRFYADPAMHDVIDKLLTVYATPDVRDSLEAPQ